MYDDLKSSYAHMLTAFRQYLGTIDLEEVKFFLQTVVEGVSFNSCETPDQVIEQMGNHFHVFNIFKVLNLLRSSLMMKCLWLSKCTMKRK